ncbi:MAG: hypothetical protein LBV28_01740, partial [Puniceicoccales bacterium]|nr:hypothetical protein [Puniceicoccales bacterium]
MSIASPLIPAAADTYVVGTKRHGSVVQPHIDEVRIENPTSPTLVEFSELVHGWRFERLEQFAREGRRVIWGGGGWNSPLIRATDTISAGINELWRKDSKLSEQIAEKDYLIPP